LAQLINEAHIIVASFMAGASITALVYELLVVR
jgi:hypothetical protein